MAVDLQFVGFEVRIADDAPEFVKRAYRAGETFQVKKVQLFKSCSKPTYEVLNESGQKIKLNGLFLDFNRWLENKRPVFPVMVDDTHQNNYEIPSSRHYYRNADA